MQSFSRIALIALAVTFVCSPLRAQQGAPSASAQVSHPIPSGYKDLAEHVDDYKQKAENGDADAQFKLGMAYWQGVGVTPDSQQAATWLKKASQDYRKPAYASNGAALYKLGSIYAIGIGVPKDMKEATAWWEKSAELGNTRAEIMMASMYFSGINEPINMVASDKWLKIAQIQGDTEHAAMRTGLEKSMKPADIATAEAQAQAWKASHPHAEAH